MDSKRHFDAGAWTHTRGTGRRQAVSVLAIGVLVSYAALVSPPRLINPHLPDPRLFVDLVAWLMEWCAAQPDRTTAAKVGELAALAGCSRAHMQEVLHRRRILSVDHGRSLVRGLGLPDDQLAHAERLVELPHLPPAKAQTRRREVLDAASARRGLSTGSTCSGADFRLTDAAARSTLAFVLGALEDERVSARTLLRAAVPPMTLQQLEAAVQAPSPGQRVAPRVQRLDSSGLTPAIAGAHHGLLHFAGEALMRLHHTEREVFSVTATVDEEGFAAYEARCRRFEQGLYQLAEEAELRPADRVVAVLSQRLGVVGPLPTDPAAQALRWPTGRVKLPRADQPPAPLPPAPSPDLPPRPHPLGITHFPTYIRLLREWGKRAGQSFSDSELAKATGLSRPAIYDLCSGSTRFSSEHVYRFIPVFGLEGDRAGQVALEGMAMVAGEPSPVEQSRLIHALRDMGLRRGVRTTAGDMHYLESRWWAAVIYAMADLPGFQPVGDWICRTTRGRVQPNAATEALEVLGALGLMTEDGQGRILTPPMVRLNGPHRVSSLHALYAETFELLRAELDQRSPDLQLDAHVIALPIKALPRLLRLAAEWREGVRADVMAAQARHAAGQPLDRVVIITQAVFPAFRLPPPRKKGAARSARARGA